MAHGRPEAPRPTLYRVPQGCPIFGELTQPVHYISHRHQSEYLFSLHQSQKNDPSSQTNGASKTPELRCFGEQSFRGGQTFSENERQLQEALVFTRG